MNVLDTVYTLQNIVENVGMLIWRKRKVENVIQGYEGIEIRTYRTDGYLQ